MKYNYKTIFFTVFFGALLFPLLVSSASVTYSKPTVDIKVNGFDGPVTIAPGASVTVSWTSTGARACTILFTDSHWSGTSGTRTSGPINFSRTYTVDCSGSGGFVLDSVKVEVVRDAPSFVSTAHAQEFELAQEPSVLGAATVVTGPRNLLPWVLGLGFLFSILIYVFLYVFRFKHYEIQMKPNRGPSSIKEALSSRG